MGLTDQPGGGGAGAAYSILFATVFLLDRPRFLITLALLGSIAVDCVTLYLCQVRSLLVLVVISFIAMSVPFAAQRRFGRFMKLAAPMLAMAVVGFFIAAAVGGDAVTGRLSTLIEGDPRSVYYTNRGTFLEHTFMDLLPEFPFGAGLGRWGMMYSYFGDHHNAASRPLWSELQWTGWVLDGGFPLTLCYTIAILVAIWTALRIALRKGDSDQNLTKWAAVLVGYSVGLLAMTFNSCPFQSTLGMDFWLLHATVFAASRQMGPATSQT
jgi:hypothetical protein